MRKIRLFSCLLVILFTTSIAGADPIGRVLPFDQYGHLMNEGGQCTATALINSFQFLSNQYPTVYGGTNLLPGAGTDLKSARDKLNSGWTHDGKTRPGTGSCPAGVNPYKNIWESKQFWFQDFAPNTTTFAGMVFGQGAEDLANWIGGANLMFAPPSIDFLLREIMNGEDVELFFNIDDNSAHAITVNGIQCDDVNNNKKCDPGEKLTLHYIDPNNPTVPLTTQLDLKDGFLTFNWNNGANTAADVTVVAVFAESPVPEPATMILLGTGLAGVAIKMRKRLKNRTS